MPSPPSSPPPDGRRGTAKQSTCSRRRPRLPPLSARRHRQPRQTDEVNLVAPRFGGETDVAVNGPLRSWEALWLWGQPCRRIEDDPKSCQVTIPPSNVVMDLYRTSRAHLIQKSIEGGGMDRGLGNVTACKTGIYRIITLSVTVV
ncbi:hypothetical protein BS78_09G053100 [Paspalum vaginatum]|nr:hypothetical protein BS78_09G053100 [Paspalum vaginatum]